MSRNEPINVLCKDIQEMWNDDAFWDYLVHSDDLCFEVDGGAKVLGIDESSRDPRRIDPNVQIVKIHGTIETNRKQDFSALDPEHPLANSLGNSMPVQDAYWLWKKRTTRTEVVVSFFSGKTTLTDLEKRLEGVPGLKIKNIGD